MDDALENVELPPLDPNDPTLLEEDPEAPAEPPPSKPRTCCEMHEVEPR